MPDSAPSRKTAGNPGIIHLQATLGRAALSRRTVAAVISKTDIVLEPSREDFSATGLRVSSVVRLHRLVTLTSAIIRRQLGELSPDLPREVDRKLAALFGWRT